MEAGPAQKAVKPEELQQWAIEKDEVFDVDDVYIHGEQVH